MYILKTPQEVIKVCKTMFLSTLSISEKWVSTICKKLKKGRDISPDKRGKYKKKISTLSDETKQSEITHINLFERVAGHYVRRTSKREFLGEKLSVAAMHRMYLEWKKMKLKMIVQIPH